MAIRRRDLMVDDGTDFSRFDAGKKCAVLMLSGGLDSTTLAYKIAQDAAFDRVTAFYINMGVPNTQAEYNQVNRTCLVLGFRLVEADFSWYRRALGGVIPAFEADPDFTIAMLGEMSRASIPGTTAAAVYAETTGCFDLFHASNKTDLGRYIYIPQTYQRIEEMMSLGHSGKPFEIHRPFANLASDEVLELAVGLSVPVEDTWSCLSSSSVHCGVCLGCKGRKARFTGYQGRNVAYRDPTKYVVP